MTTAIGAIALIVIILLSILAAEVYGIQDEEEQEEIRKEKNMKERVKIINCTNQEMKKEIGKVRDYFKMDNRAYLEYPDKPNYGVRTSEIQSEVREGNKITIKTQNSTYELELVEDKEDGRN